jgi:hypothetical protein
MHVAVPLLLALFVLFIVLEGRRQRRKYGPSVGANMLGAGMLELQRHLQPERKVEILLEKREEPDRDTSGDPPKPG